MNQEYKGKVVIGRTDYREGVVIFAICGRGSWDEYYLRRGKLTETVMDLIENSGYAPEDIQNGPTEADVREHSYLGIFPPVEEEIFNDLIGKLRAA